MALSNLNTLAREQAAEPGHDEHAFNQGVRALASVFGHRQWNALTLLQQLAVLADFLPMTSDLVFSSAADAAGHYHANIGHDNLASYADTQLVNLVRASSAAAFGSVVDGRERLTR